jgi:hypothetical protein
MLEGLYFDGCFWRGNPSGGGIVRCQVTGNPCGTDTVTHRGCDCQNCKAVAEHPHYGRGWPISRAGGEE